MNSRRKIGEFQIPEDRLPAALLAKEAIGRAASVRTAPTVTAALPGKIERHCPRCGRHAYHWLTPRDTASALKTTKLPTASCANCGHQWPCRVMGKDQ